MKRKLGDWLDNWLRYTEKAATPYLFRKWVGISMISMALERKVWTYTPAYLSNLYPNLYVFLVAPPAVGKTVMSNQAYDILDALEEHKIAPDSVSRASFMDAMREARRDVIYDNGRGVAHFNSLSIICNELGVFLTEYNTEFMSTLTDLYDCKKYREKKRGKDLDYKLDAMSLCFLASTTPAQLQELLPENSYEFGFMSRVILIYTEETPLPDNLFDETGVDLGLRQSLIDDLKIIGNLFGACRWEPEVKELLNKWNRARRPGGPSHPRLGGYSNRRLGHAMKLIMCAHFSRTDDFLITMEDYQRGMDWMHEAEKNMGDVFAMMRSGGEINIMKEAHHWSWQYHLSNGRKGVPEGMIIEYIQSKGIPAQTVERVFNIMLKVGYFVKELDRYTPRPPKNL